MMITGLKKLFWFAKEEVHWPIPSKLTQISLLSIFSEKGTLCLCLCLWSTVSLSLSLVHCVFVFVFGPLCLCRCHPPSHLRMCWDTQAPGYASIRRILGIHGFIGWKPNASGKLLVCPFPNDSHANYFKSLQTNHLASNYIWEHFLGEGRSKKHSCHWAARWRKTLSQERNIFIPYTRDHVQENHGRSFSKIDILFPVLNISFLSFQLESDTWACLSHCHRWTRANWKLHYTGWKDHKMKKSYVCYIWTDPCQLNIGLKVTKMVTCLSCHGE